MKSIILLLLVGFLITTNAFSETLRLHDTEISKRNVLEIQKMTKKEKEYLLNKLSEIKKDMTREEVIEILGTPSRNLPQKVNWWVQSDQKKIRAGVYFGDNKATDVVLDGGQGSFYYRQKL